MLAVIRIRGSAGVDRRIEDTLGMLRLNRVNHCVLVPDNPTFRGMLAKVRNMVTWGKISDETLEKLIFKRSDRKADGKEAKEIAKKIIKNQSLDGTGIGPVFRLSPPSKGYRSIKTLFPRGSLGDRGEGINGLIKRMI